MDWVEETTNKQTKPTPIHQHPTQKITNNGSSDRQDKLLPLDLGYTQWSITPPWMVFIHEAPFRVINFLIGFGYE